MMTSQVLRAMQKAGFVERRAHAEDGRAFAVALSADGAALLRQAEPRIADTDARFHGPLGPDKEAFGDALRLLSGIRPRRRVKAGIA
jgi:DNA-binding MarR family transcriptional regulator